ncbi:MAG TPA: hypothetical protein VKR78_02090, partial [Acidimicrobiales bacterium]|nr:hypothetical protein [Acidimicrobiales bacterium]
MRSRSRSGSNERSLAPGLSALQARGTGNGKGNGSTPGIPGLDVRTGGLGSPAQAVALATLCVVLFLTFLDNTVVSVGLANI